MNKSELRELLSDRLSILEVETIFFDLSNLGLDIEDFDGGKSSKIQDLIIFLENRENLEALISWLEKNRPDINLDLDNDIIEVETISQNREGIVRPISDKKKWESWHTWVATGSGIMAMAAIFLNWFGNPPSPIAPEDSTVSIVEDTPTFMPENNIQVPTEVLVETPMTEPTMTLEPIIAITKVPIVIDSPTLTSEPVSFNAPTVNGHEWIEIPEGPFLMGSSADNPSSYDNAEAEYELELDTYWIAKHETTNIQYKIFVDSKFEEDGFLDHLPNSECEVWDEEGNYDEAFSSYPVVCVTWYDVIAYSEWLSQESGLHITIPNEAQWEKAASWESSSKRKRKYPWGEFFDEKRLNCSQATCPEDGFDELATIGSFPKGRSPYGVEDMAGNVWEWTTSLWGINANEPDFSFSPSGGSGDLSAGPEVSRVARGGSWSSGSRGSRTAYRFRYLPSSWTLSIGFRLTVQSPSK